MQALNQLATTMLPEDWVYVDRRDFLKERFKAHDINIVLKTEDEANEIRRQQEESIQNKLQIEMAQAEIGYKKAQTMAQLTKAKEKNVIANKEAQTPIEQPAGDDPRLTEGELALQQTDKMGKEAEIRRQEESHALKMAHADEAHTVKKAIDTTKAAQDIAIKGEQTKAQLEAEKETRAHDMKMKEHMTKASAEAKKTAAKQKPAKSKKKE